MSRDTQKYQWLDPTVINADGSKFVVYLTSDLQEDGTPFYAKLGIEQSYKDKNTGHNTKQTVRCHPTVYPTLELFVKKGIEINNNIRMGLQGPIGGSLPNPGAIA